MSIEDLLSEDDDPTEWVELPFDFFIRPNAICDEIICVAVELERARRLEGSKPTFFGIPDDKP